MRILIAPNAFKNCLSSLEVAQEIESALKELKLKLSLTVAPIADGGDGTLDVIKQYFKNSKFINCIVHDPLMRKIKSGWLMLDKNTAFIELSKASGLALLNQKELNPLKTNTVGTGELIISALNKKCKKIILAIGGSATVDAGLGILYALGVRFYDKNRKSLKPSGSTLCLIKEIDSKSIDKRIFDVEITVLCDVNNLFSGKNGSIKYAIQKGARKKDLKILKNGIENVSTLINKITRKKSHTRIMTGAAGGVSFSMMTFLDAELIPGFSYLAKLMLIEQKIKKADLIISGEGSLDKQTIFGKGVYGLSRLALKHKKSVMVLCGTCDKKINWKKYNLQPIIQLRADNMPISESIRNVRKLLKNSILNNSKLFIKD